MTVVRCRSVAPCRNRQSRCTASCYSKVLSSALGQRDRYPGTLRCNRGWYPLALFGGTLHDPCHAGGGGRSQFAAGHSRGPLGVFSFRERPISCDIGFAGRYGESVRANCVERRLPVILHSAGIRRWGFPRLCTSGASGKCHESQSLRRRDRCSSSHGGKPSGHEPGPTVLISGCWESRLRHSFRIEPRQATSQIGPGLSGGCLGLSCGLAEGYLLFARLPLLSQCGTIVAFQSLARAGECEVVWPGGSK